MEFNEKFQMGFWYPLESGDWTISAKENLSGITYTKDFAPDSKLADIKAWLEGPEVTPDWVKQKESADAAREAAEQEAKEKALIAERERKSREQAEADKARAEAGKVRAEADKAEAEARAAEAERKAKELSRLIANTITGKDLTTEEEEEASSLLPPWQEGVSYDKGDVVGYKGKVEMALEDHIATLDNAPGMETGMWSSDVAGTPKEPTPYAPSKIYNKGDRIIWSGVVYQSNIDGNDKPPDQAPETWDLVSSD